MNRVTSGELHTTYQVRDLRITSLRDGYVDMPIRRLRQPGDRTFGDNLPSKVPLFDGALRLSVNAFAYTPSDATASTAPRPIASTVVKPTGLPHSFSGGLVNVEFSLDAPTS